MNRIPRTSNMDVAIVKMIDVDTKLISRVKIIFIPESMETFSQQIHKQAKSQHKQCQTYQLLPLLSNYLRQGLHLSFPNLLFVGRSIVFQWSQLIMVISLMYIQALHQVEIFYEKIKYWLLINEKHSRTNNLRCFKKLSWFIFHNILRMADCYPGKWNLMNGHWGCDCDACRRIKKSSI